MKLSFPLLAMLLLLPMAGRAQSLTLVWHRIAGGGGVSQPAGWQLHGTIGQAEVSGGDGPLSAGFWNAASGELPPPPATSLALVSSEDPAGFHDAVSFTASLTVPGNNPADASGSVQFLTNGAPAGSAVALSFGQAAITLAALPRGTNTLVAEYSGDDNFPGSMTTLLQVVTNHPPVARPMNVICPPGSTVQISLTDLATNWTDADGDAVVLTAINPLTTQGVALLLTSLATNLDGTFAITNTALINYTNASNRNDQFSYTISDGQGGTSVGQVNLLLSTNSLAGQPTRSPVSNGNSVTLQFTGLPGYEYEVQRSTNLVNWTTIWETNAPSNGIFNFNDNFADLAGNGPAAAYYRLAWIP